VNDGRKKVQKTAADKIIVIEKMVAPGGTTPLTPEKKAVSKSLERKARRPAEESRLPGIPQSKKRNVGVEKEKKK